MGTTYSVEPQYLSIVPRHYRNNCLIGCFHSSPVFLEDRPKSRLSRNPESSSCDKTVMPTNTGRVDRSMSYPDHSCSPASGLMGERALDSRCGENDGRL